MTMQPRIFKLKKSLIPLLGLLASTGALAVNSYDPGTKTLALDTVQVGATTYRRVTVMVDSFDQLSVAGGAPGQDSFDPATNILRMGNVNFESNTYTNVSVRINGYSLQGVGSDANGYLQNTVPTPTYAAGSDVLNAFNYLNNERARCGFGKLVQNSALDRAALSYATYYDERPFSEMYRETPGVVGFTGVTASDRAAAQGYQTNSAVYDVNGRDVTTYNTNLTPGSTAQLANSAVDLTKKAFARPYDGLRLLSEGTEVGFGKKTRDSMAGADRTVGTTLDIAVGNASYAQGQTPSTNTAVRTYPCEGSSGSIRKNAFSIVTESSGSNGAPIAVVGQPGRSLTIDSASVTELATGSSYSILSMNTRANDPKGASLPNDWTGFVMTNAPLRANTPHRVVINYTSGGLSGTTTFTFTPGTN
jgi:hypothetical protein